MNTYSESKLVLAKAMTLGEYYALRAWELRDWDTLQEKDANEEGYLVVCSDRPANHPDYDGHISWSPKVVFDKTTVSLGRIAGRPAYQQRVRAERAELAKKLDALSTFLNSNTNVPSLVDKGLLQVQRSTMTNYLHTLDLRIKGFDS